MVSILQLRRAASLICDPKAATNESATLCLFCTSHHNADVIVPGFTRVFDFFASESCIGGRKTFLATRNRFSAAVLNGNYSKGCPNCCTCAPCLERFDAYRSTLAKPTPLQNNKRAKIDNTSAADELPSPATAAGQRDCSVDAEQPQDDMMHAGEEDAYDHHFGDGEHSYVPDFAVGQFYGSSSSYIGHIRAYSGSRAQSVFVEQQTAKFTRILFPRVYASVDGSEQASSWPSSSACITVQGKLCSVLLLELNVFDKEDGDCWKKFEVGICDCCTLVNDGRDAREDLRQEIEEVAAKMLLRSGDINTDELLSIVAAFEDDLVGHSSDTAYSNSSSSSANASCSVHPLDAIRLIFGCIHVRALFEMASSSTAKLFCTQLPRLWDICNVDDDFALGDDGNQEFDDPTARGEYCLLL
jgi:hypothetical protein